MASGSSTQVWAGWAGAVVEEARARGDPRLPEYEALWCALLADYERLCDEIARLADETSP